MRSRLFGWALVITLVLFSASAWFSSQSWWGTNHLSFLPLFYWGLFAAIGVLALALLLFPQLDRFISERMLAWISAAYQSPRLTASIVALVAGTIYVLFPAKTHFLGDGYTILSIYGTGDVYYLKWTEAGAIEFLRASQWLLGGYTADTVTTALRALSDLSGIVAAFNLCLIASYISRTPKSYLLTAVTLLCSGSQLLFFGYLEFYPLLWACGTGFLLMSIRYLTTGRGLTIALLLYVATVAMHLQALYFLPGVAYLIYHQLVVRKLPSRVITAYRWIVVALAVAGFAAIVWLISTRIDIASAFLPLWQGRPDAPDYAILTPKHLWDIVNLLFVMIPGLLAIIVLCKTKIADESDRPLRIWLFLLSIGSLIFLLTIDPVFGLGRDWDLMSFTLLAPIILLLLLARPVADKLSMSRLSGYALVCFSATFLYLAANLSVEPSEERYHSLLENYGSKNRSGWTILSSYYAERKEWERTREIARELAHLFPDEGILLGVVDDLANGQYERALKNAGLLYQKNPSRVDYIQVYASALNKNGQREQAIELYRQATKLRPYLADQHKELGLILLDIGKYDDAIIELEQAWKQDRSLFAAGEGIALAHIRKGDFSSAEKMAEQLIREGDTPGAHLTQMVICLNQGDMEQARVHFLQFKQLGTKRADYANILQYYGQYWPEK
jgi:tetratricopeptide (TPR) repeat protein